MASLMKMVNLYDNLDKTNTIKLYQGLLMGSVNEADQQTLLPLRQCETDSPPHQSSVHFEVR